MKFIIALLFSFVFTFCGLAQGVFPIWVEDYAWGSDSEDHLMDILEVDIEFSTVSAGHTISSMSGELSEINNGLQDFWIVKMDTAKNIVFDHTFGSDTTELFSTLLETKDGGFLLAGSSAGGKNGDKSEDSKGGFDFWIMKISKNGTFQWDKTIGGAKDDFLNSAVMTNDGGYLLGGESVSDASGDKSDNSYGDKDYWLVKVNGAGNVVWDKSFGGDSTDVLQNIVLENNDIFVGGSSISDSSGVKSIDSYGGFDYWILKLSLTGTIIDEWVYGGVDDDFLEEIRVHPRKQALWIAGTSNSNAGGNKLSPNFGSGDFWVFVIDHNGLKTIDNSYGSAQNDICKDLEISPEGAAIVAGFSRSGGGNKTSGTNGGEDFWIIKVDTNGGKFWDRNYGGSNDDSLQAIFIKCDRGLLVGGYSESGVSGDRTHYNRGLNDYWAFRLDIPTRPYFRASNICTGVPLNFYDESDVWPDSWAWDFDDPTSANNSSADQHPTHTYSVAGVYDVMMTIKEGCQNDTILMKSITVFDNTVLGMLDLGEDFSVCEGTLFNLKNIENPPIGASYVWSTGDSTAMIQQDSSGVYTAVMSDRNCSVVDSVEVGDCPTTFIPNVFTPNGDEINDVFYVKGFGMNEFELLIFDRWGELIYQSNDMNEGWDGTINSRNAQIDVYVYIVNYRGIGGELKYEIGHISLIR
jgi:gliding motility-associated-like protein